MMTIEEKAKAYDEALERAIVAYKDTDRHIKATIERIFPDLKESEDERMMWEFNDWLCEEIECRTNDLRDEKDRRTLNMLCYVLTKVKDYLEKQKEHSMSAEEVLARAGLKPYKDGNKWCILVGDNIQEGICGFGDTIDEALYQFLMEILEMQKEQPTDEKTERVIKAARRVLNNWLDGTDCPDVSGDFAELEYAIRKYDGEEMQKEQKPERINITEMVAKYRVTDEYVEGEYKGKPVNCMIRAYEKGIRDTLLKVKEQKPAWSEEDEKIRKDLIYDIERLPMQGVLTHRPTSEYIAHLELKKL